MKTPPAVAFGACGDQGANSETNKSSSPGGQLANILFMVGADGNFPELYTYPPKAPTIAQEGCHAVASAGQSGYRIATDWNGGQVNDNHRLGTG
jgi:hypothetical protein